MTAASGTLPHPEEQPAAQTCVLQHPVFCRVSGISFRRSPSDGEPVMVMPFGEGEASLPLRSLQREFEIPDDSADGRMLALIAESLGYVTALHPGDPLPAEVVSGKASWAPEGHHLRRAQVRLRLALLGWQDPEAAKRALRDIESGGRLHTDPELRTTLQNASRKAVAELGCEAPEEVMARLDALAPEFSYVEALRDRLLLRIEALVARARRIAAALSRSDTVRSDAIGRVIKMAGTSLAEIGARFERLDGVCRDIIDLLREPELRLAFVHESRDALYRSQIGWDPILVQWDAVSGDDEAALWQAVANTYQFLARRYLPVTEWPSFAALRSSLSTSSRNAMRW